MESRLILFFQITKEFFDAIYSQGLEYDYEVTKEYNLDEEKGVIDFGLFTYMTKTQKID